MNEAEVSEIKARIWVRELERQGLIERPSTPLDEDFLSSPRPRMERGASLVEAVLEERGTKPSDHRV